MDDYFGDDLDPAAFEAAERAVTAARPAAAAAAAAAASSTSASIPPRPAAAAAAAADATRKVQQPKPQALPARAGASSILVSPRQKGNPILNNIRSMPWEYSDIPADFVLGATTCALFLSLKYHRLHPEYVYSRIKTLAGKYSLRVLLVMVDIENHEDPLKELSKTSLINNVTIILTWSANEAGRYLELFKSCEHAAPTSIKAQQSLSYSDKLVEFVTVPRSINKTDAVGLVSNFGSVRTAVNALPEDVSLIAGWGEKKVKTWCQAVREPFRVHKTTRRTAVSHENSRATLSRDVTQAEVEHDAQVAARLGIGSTLPFVESPAQPDASRTTADPDLRPDTRIADDFGPGSDEEEAMAEIGAVETAVPLAKTASLAVAKPSVEDGLSEGMAAALAKLRKT
ncbi:hypothetical protein MBLNU459_g1367t1 [Dothideomycetes sp. NU459]